VREFERFAKIIEVHVVHRVVVRPLGISGEGELFQDHVSVDPIGVHSTIGIDTDNRCVDATVYGTLNNLKHTFIKLHELGRQLGTWWAGRVSPGDEDDESRLVLVVEYALEMGDGGLESLSMGVSPENSVLPGAGRADPRVGIEEPTIASGRADTVQACAPICALPSSGNSRIPTS